MLERLNNLKNNTKGLFTVDGLPTGELSGRKVALGVVAFIGVAVAVSSLAILT